MSDQKYLFRVYYDGKLFNGFQRQPNGNTIENYIELALIRSNLIKSFKTNFYQSVSRTDTGVSAIANVFSLNCKNEPNLNRITANLPTDGSLQIWGYSSIPGDFKVRSPDHKIYSYYVKRREFESIYDFERIYGFEGNHNFSTFMKRDGAGRFQIKSVIFDISVEKVKGGYFINIKGDKFGREQIRRMIGFIMDEGYNKVQVHDLLQKKIPIHIRPANPKFLTLVKANYKGKIAWEGSVKDLQISNFSHKLLIHNHFSMK
ncbi:MAG: hypothetical protein ACW99A_02420 [Candidatus Kariarchaeaceae archaeon]|jgi:tRNA pseudouridine38-40 synthase